MDIFTIVIVCVGVFLLFLLCGYCCKRSRRGRVLRPPATVTTTHVTTTQMLQPPYPIDSTAHPMPQPTYPPALGFSGYTNAYQTAPYPPAPGPNIVPPPSYNEAILQPATSLPPAQMSENLLKQPAYNPNY